jgi:hypothetical protein
MSTEPTSYLDSSILSALHYSGGNALILPMRTTTRDWWVLERPLYQVWTSKITVMELEKGRYSGESKAVAEAMRLPHLPLTAAVKDCARILLDEGIVPATEEADALHLAFSIVHRIDYLLTWNHAHLANLQVQGRLEAVCKRHGWRAPLVVSPDTIPLAALGHTIRRTDE